MMYQCCIFDLDGTLINTIHSMTHTMNLALAGYGLGPIDDAHTKVFVGDGARTFVERALVFFGDTGLVHLEETVKTYEALFQEHCMYRIEPYDGIGELLKAIKDRGMKMAVVTNKAHERAVEIMELVYGKGYFDLIMGEQAGIKRKPDPDGVLMTMKKLGVKPEECLYLGDTNTDMETGRNAGVDTAGVTWGFRSREELMAFHPKYLVKDPREVISILKGA